jgi:PAS domain S-box-containing protein
VSSDGRQIRLLGRAVDCAPAAFFVLDESGHFVAANRYACTMLGYRRAELLDRAIDAIAVSPSLRRLLNEGEVGIVPLRHKDGGTVVVRYEARPAEAGPIRLLVMVAYPRRVLPADATPQEAAARGRRWRDGRGLSQRELEVLQLMADGFENDEISSQLVISRETVKSHVRRVLRKLRARSRTHAVALGLRSSLID